MGDYCEKPQYGYTASASLEPKTCKFLRITDLQEQRVQWDSVPWCEATENDVHRYGLVHGDVLVARIGATTGSTAIIVDPPRSVFASYLIRLRPKHELNPFFLYFYTKSRQFLDWIDAHKDSNLKGGVNVPILLGAPIHPPLPPEQQKIAAVLWKLQRAIATQDRLLAATADLKQSAMQRLFTHGLKGEPLTDTEIGPMPESWQPITIGSFAKLSAGGTPSRGTPEYWNGGTIPWVKTGEVDYGVILETEEKITPLGLANSAAKLLPKGTLLVAMYGQGVTRGKVAILGIEAATNQACVAIRHDEGKVRTDFLFHSLTHGYERLRGLAHGGQQQNLNADLIRGFRFACPQDTDEQRAIAAALATLDRKLAHHRAKRAALHDLFETLLHKLMTAEIRVADLDIDTSEITDHFVGANKMINGARCAARSDHFAGAGKMVEHGAKGTGH